MQEHTSNYKEELLLNLKDKEYRKAFVSSHINNGIAFQIRTMRGDLTQEELGKLAGMKQEAICRLENPNYGSFTLKTLKEIAAAFNVALMVRFVPFSELVKWDLNLSAESLEVPSFDQDPYFKETIDEKIADNLLKEIEQSSKSKNVIDFNKWKRITGFIDSEPSPLTSLASGGNI
jgi:transcriptional regulator with XRE-family HTH domain